MFELFVAFKYLLPRKGSLSSTLISIVSILVISLVVWLIVVFLSVTTGIEKNWVNKLTSVNAPLRITPSDSYYKSFYYLADSISNSSGYQFKTIGEKAEASVSNPYSPDVDSEIPQNWPAPQMIKGELLDPVKETYTALNSIPNIAYQDFEISSALLKLFSNHSGQASSLSQMSYLSSIPDNNPNLPGLLTTFTKKDMLNFIALLRKLGYNNPTYKLELKRFLSGLDFKNVKTPLAYTVNLQKLNKNKASVKIFAEMSKSGALINLTTTNDIKNRGNTLLAGDLILNDIPLFKSRDGRIFKLSNDMKINFPSQVSIQAELKNSETLELECKAQVGKNKLVFTAFLEELELQEIKIGYSPKLSIFGIYLPKSLKESGILAGDRGQIIFSSLFPTSQEQHIEIYVKGFYDPGVLPTGNRCLLVPKEITRAINSALITYSPDGSPTNGIYVWCDDLKKIDGLKTQIIALLKAKNADKYWRVSTYKEYEFSKDLMQQFQSDKTLFTLIAFIILTVACSNIVSMLILLINDKKKEIATFQAMGATKRNIAFIFGISGVTIGLLSSFIGVASAIFTLKYLNLLVNLLSAIQGHAAFNSTFFGQSLPNSLSIEAIYFILIATPLISLVAGVIPALKATKISISSTLRTQ